MNKSVVSILIAICSLLTFVAVGSNPASGTSDDSPVYKRIEIYTQERSLSFRELDVSGNELGFHGARTMGNLWVFSKVAFDTVIRTQSFEDESEARNFWDGYTQTYMSQISADYELFQVHTVSYDGDMKSTYHFRLKSQ